MCFHGVFTCVSGSLGSFVVHESHTHKIPVNQSQDTAVNTHNFQACSALIESTAGESVEQRSHKTSAIYVYLLSYICILSLLI